MGIQQRLAKFLVPDQVWEEYHTGQENDVRGVWLDMELVHAAIDMDTAAEVSRFSSEATANRKPRSAPTNVSPKCGGGISGGVRLMFAIYSYRQSWQLLLPAQVCRSGRSQLEGGHLPRLCICGKLERLVCQYSIRVVALFNLRGAIAQFQRNDCSICAVEMIWRDGVRNFSPGRCVKTDRYIVQYF